MLRIGHRGTSEGAPENSIAAVRLAARAGLDGIEYDLQRSRDGVPVVMHDATLRRTAGEARAVSSLPASALTRLTLSDSGERVPSNERLLREARGRFGIVLIELKARRLEKAVLEQIYSNGMEGVAVVTSFSSEILEAVRGLDRGIRIGLIHGPLSGAIETASGLKASFLSSNANNLTRRFVERAHAHNLGVLAWTVNSGEKAARMERLGVDGVMSDSISLLKTLNRAT